MLGLVRVLAGLGLGLVIVIGLLYSLVVGNVSQRLANPEVYNVAISDTDAYNRIYDEVLVDEALADQTANLLGGLNIADSEQEKVQDLVVETFRDVLAPAYIKNQVEDNIGRFTSYLRYEQEDLEVYIILQEPLDRIGPSVLNIVHRYIDRLKIEDPATPGCSVDELLLLAHAFSEPLSRISNGKLPQSAPSLKILTRECRERGFDRFVNLLVNSRTTNAQATAILEGVMRQLREPFVEGDTRAFLKAVADPLVEPLIDNAVADIRRQLQPGDRFDVLQWLAGESGDLADFGAQVEPLRGIISYANGPARIIALVMVALGSLLVALVHVPRPAQMLRWPGVTLLMGGGVCLSIGFVLNSVIPGRISEVIARAASSLAAGVPDSVIDLVGDLLESFARQVTAGFLPATSTVMAVGVVLIAASFFMGALTAAVRRVLLGPGRHRRSH